MTISLSIIMPNAKKVVSKLTKARFLFKVRNTSCFLIDRRSAKSPGSSRAYSTVSAMYLTFPYWKSLIEELARKGAPSSTKEGF